MRQPFNWDLKYSYSRGDKQVCRIIYDGEDVGSIYSSGNHFKTALEPIYKSAIAFDLDIVDPNDGEAVFQKLIKVQMLRVENMTKIVIDRNTVDSVSRQFDDGVIHV